MGAALTTQNAKSNLELRNKIDYIAKNYIFDSDFTDMTKLGNEKYCNKLVKKVSDVFRQNKDSIDILLLRKKLYEIKKNKNPELIDENENEFKFETNANVKMSGEPQKEIPLPKRIEEEQEQEQEQIIGGEKRATTRSRSRSRSPTTRKRMPSTTPQNIHNIKKKCNEIAKFYVLFAHLFSCIVSTVNPSFEIGASSSDKKSADSLDFCSSRLNLLINGELIENSEGDVTIKPNICKTNVSDSGSALRLVDLPGIKALLKLFKNGGDDSAEDVKYLYKAFTGKDAPRDVNIEHIPLQVYSKDAECSGSGSSSSSSSSSRNDSQYRGGAFNEYQDDSYRYLDRDERDIRNLNVDVRRGIYLTGVIGNPTKEKLFSDYINNIKFMIQKSEKNRSLLLEILSEMFTYTYDSDGEISGVIINPSLTYKELQSLVRRTRKIIIKLYTECEEDYNEGLDIFFALIQEKILSKLTLQDDMLRRELEQSIFGKQERYIPVNPFQNPYQNQNPFQNQNPNKNQFVPPHFKQDVIKEFKQILKDNNVDANENELSQKFKISKPGLDAWIDEEIQYANGPEMLDPYQVANDFYASINEEDVSDTVTPSPAAAPVAVGAPAAAAAAAPVAVGAPAAAAAASPAAAAAASPVAITPPPVTVGTPFSPTKAKKYINK
jgi:hypothetical protein